MSSTTPISSSSNTGLTTGALNRAVSLTSNDFLNLMVTQLENQDPLQPTSNDQLLSQMSQIGQLQNTTALQSSITSLTQQSQITSGAALIGKKVEGLDDANKSISGVVNSVRVASNAVTLELDSGASLSLANVTSISPSSGTTAAN